MADYYHCPKCKKVFPLLGGADKKCISCGDTHGAVYTQDQARDMFKAGAIWNIDPKTGGPAKKRRR